MPPRRIGALIEKSRHAMPLDGVERSPSPMGRSAREGAEATLRVDFDVYAR
ncbi:MAG: hypothetical protein JWP44_4962 [Mucilaginibacter sp.]|nr:hypothetical protein [Mucilaginibacter sp.]